MTGIKVNKEIFRNAGICLIFSLILLQTGCTSIVPLKATYPPSYTYTTNLSKDKFWDKVITMLDTNGIVIKAIDSDIATMRILMGSAESHSWDSRIFVNFGSHIHKVDLDT